MNFKEKTGVQENRRSPW